MFVLAVSVITTILYLAWSWLHRGPLTSLQWTTLAAALLGGLYGEKALGRFDFGHVMQNINVALPLYVLMGAGILRAAERELRRRERPAWQWEPSRLVQPVAVALALVGLWLGGQWSSVWRPVEQAPGRLQMVAPGPTALPSVGYMYPGGLDTVLLDDLDAVLDTYAGEDGKVFDFTNAPGYIYYLLGREPAVPFVHISMAAVERAQQAVVDDLAAAQPAVVVFDNTRFGIAAWDGPRAEVRHFEVSQYLLDHWTPVVAGRRTALPGPRRPAGRCAQSRPTWRAASPDTTDLYFSQPTCNWGYSANYLESDPRGPSLRAGGAPRGVPDHRQRLGVRRRVRQERRRGPHRRG